MNIESLKTFITLAHCGSFTKSAQILIVAQSTVSSRIKDLETELGKSLFNRGKNNAILTPAGKALLEYAERIVEMESDAINEVNMVGKYSGVIHMGVPHNLFDCYIGEFIKHFIEEYPDISVKVSIAHSEELIPNMNTTNYDVAFVYLPYQPPNYICEPFTSEQVVLVTSSVNDKYETGITRNQMSELSFIYTQFLDYGYDWILPSHRVYSLNINIISKMVPFLKTGNWFCFIPRQVVAKEIEDGSLLEIPLLDVDLPERQSFMIYKNNYERIEPLKKWIDMIKSITKS